MSDTAGSQPAPAAPNAPAPQPVDDVAELLRPLLGAATPALTWVSPGERIELSGRVLTNWVAKSAHLIDDLDPESVTLSLGLHWRSVTLALATWLGGRGLRTAGGDLEFVPAGAPAADAARDVAAVALPGLALSAGEAEGRIDYNREVRSFADVHQALAYYGPPTPAVLDGRALAAAADPALARVALSAELDLAAGLAGALARLAAGQPIVLVDDGGDPAVCARLADPEFGA